MAGLQGRVFGGYQLTEQMEGGGIAEVYRGRPATPGGREVVVKVMYPEFARQPGFLPHFRRIVQLSSRLASHPHILPLLAHGEDAGYVYLVTPYVQAGTLRQRLQQGSRLGVSDVAPFFRQLCDALTYAHSLGVTHGNLKPSNVFLFEGRHVLLGDFGLLWDVSHMDMNHVGSGTDAVEYLAPEVVTGQVTQLSDIYSLGAVLFAALVGHAPFHANRPAEVFAAHARQPVPSLVQANAALPPGVLALDSVIQRAMAKRPEERFPSAAAVAQAIEQVIRQAGPQPAAPAMPSFGVPNAPVAYPAVPPRTGGTPGIFAPAAAVPPIAALGQGMLGAAALPLGYVPPATGPAPSTALRPLDPPFPPLPATEQEDPPYAPVPSSSLADEAVLQPTTHLPSPADLAPPQPTMRIPAPDAAAPTALPGPEPDLGPQHMPAVRPPKGPGVAPRAARLDAPTGFIISGGPRRQPDESAVQADSSGEWPPAGWSGPLVEPAGDLDGASSEYSALGAERDDDASASLSAFGESYAEGLSSAHSALSYTGEQPEWRILDESGRHSGPSGGEGQPGPGGAGYSATQLGLPRLTSPAMSDRGPSWQELVGDAQGPAGFAASGALAGDGAAREPHWTDAGAGMWTSSHPRQGGPSGDGWSGETGGWQATRPASASYAALSAAWPAQGATGYEPAATQGKRGRWGRQKAAEDEDSGFDDDRVWTRGLSVMRGRRRWPRRLALLMVVILLVDLAGVIVARPDLCPTAGCRAWSAAIHQRFPFLASVAAPLSLAATPAAARLTTMTGGSSSTTISVQNTGASAITWSAASELAWLNISPATGTLAPGASSALSLTARPVGIEAGTYHGDITLTSDEGVLTLPVTVVVAAGPRLTVSPATLSYNSCGTAQPVTLTNGGGSGLTFTAVPSQTDALSLSTGSGSLAPGQHTTISVTLLCAATQGTEYTVNITSTGGSAVVTVQYP
jgi:hypothetical protein